MGHITLSVVIGTYNRIRLLRQCLDALIGKIKVRHEIIVVDAGSTDGTLDYLKGLSQIRLVCDQERIGQAQSLNRVFRTLESKYVCWLSDDNVVLPGMLDQAVSILRFNPGIGMVALKVKDVRGPLTEQEYLGGIWPSGILNCNQGMLPLQLLRKLGGLDEEFRDYGIDGDLTTRVLLEGYKVVFTKKIAIHHLRDHETKSWTDNDGRKQKMGRARELYRQKFEALITSQYGGHYSKMEQENSPQLRAILLWYGRAKKIGLSIQNLTGLTERDWRNLIVARFVSKMDFLINIRKPYYLVQQLPNGLLKNLPLISSPKN